MTNPSGVADDLGVVARDFGSGELQVVAVAPANRERRLVERDQATPEQVADGQVRARWRASRCRRGVPVLDDGDRDERLSLRKEFTRNRRPSGETSKNDRGPTGRASKRGRAGPTSSDGRSLSSGTAIRRLSRAA